MAIKESTGLIIRIIIVFFMILTLMLLGTITYGMSIKEGFLILISSATGAFLAIMIQDIIRYGERNSKK